MNFPCNLKEAFMGKTKVKKVMKKFCADLISVLNLRHYLSVPSVALMTKAGMLGKKTGNGKLIALGET